MERSSARANGKKKAARMTCEHSLKVNAYALTDVWDDKFTGVRYVML